MESGVARRQLLQVLGLGFGLAVAIGNTIGVGILRAPGEVATHLPWGWLFIAAWLCGGLYALLGAISVAELGTAVPESGGQYVFARRAFGPYAGFVVGWSDWLSTCGSAAAVALVIGEYSAALWPSVAGQEVTVAALVAVAFALLQWRGIAWGSRVQNVTSLLKATGFASLVVACFALGGKGTAAGPAPPLKYDDVAPTVGFLLALQAVIFTYDGWTGVIYFSEEVRDPARNIPRALLGGVLSITAIYILVNVALLYVLGVSQIAGQKLAVGAAAQAVFGKHGDTIVRVLTIVSMLSGINAHYLMASRVLFSMSRDRLSSRAAIRVNEGGTPTVALFLSAAVALLFTLSGAFARVVAILAFFFVANYTVSFLAVFALRWREPALPRPQRAWGYPWTTALAVSGSLAFLAGSVAGDTENSLRALLLLAVSYPVFRLLRR